MFGISQKDLQPIQEMTRVLRPEADQSKIGDWGMLFFCCGAQAGQALSWKATVFENIRVPGVVEHFQFIKDGTVDAETYGIQFSELIKQWATAEYAHALARRNLQQMTDATETSIENSRHYFALAIMLNSLSELDTKDFKPVKQWAHGEPQRWQTLFFAAGLLLSNDKDILWRKMRNTMLGVQEWQNQGLKELFVHFAEQR